MEKILKTLDSLDALYGRWLIYFVMIPFLYPRGFVETSDFYKGFFTLWLYLAMAVVVAWVVYDLLRNGPKNRWLECAVLVYYLLFVGITVLVQGGINAGLQKMFSAPALYLFCFLCLRKNSQRFLTVTGRILAVIFALNISVFSPPIAEKLMELYHVHFLGHVQVGAQYGVVGLLVAYLLLKLYPQRRDLGIVLLGTSVITVLWTGTLVGYIVIAVLAFGALLLWTKPARRQGWIQKGLRMDARWLVAGQLILSVGLLIFSLTKLDVLLRNEFLSFNGRTFVWRDGIARFLERPVLGYGAYGVILETFWSEGMNYAHSELLQRLMDGGVVLCLVFYGMLWVLLGRVGRTADRDAVAVTNVLLFAVLMVMLFESVTEYHYITVFFALAACLPEVCGPGMIGEKERIE